MFKSLIFGTFISIIIGSFFGVLFYITFSEPVSLYSLPIASAILGPFIVISKKML